MWKMPVTANCLQKNGGRGLFVHRCPGPFRCSGGHFGHRKTVNAGNDYSNSLTFTLDESHLGHYFLFVNVDDARKFTEKQKLNNAMMTPFSATYTTLTEGADAAGSLAHDGDVAFYEVEVGEDGVLVIDFSGTEGSCVAIYVSKNEAPTTDYDHTSEEVCADNHNYISGASAGTYYILLENMQDEVDYTLSAGISQLQVSSVSPTSQAKDTSFTMSIEGAGFHTGASVILISEDGLEYAASTASYLNDSLLNATFNLAGVPVGVYGLQVSNDMGDASILAGAFEIIESTSSGALEVEQIIPDPLPSNAAGEFYIRYKNVGDSSLVAPMITVFAEEFVASVHVLHGSGGTSNTNPTIGSGGS